MDSSSPSHASSMTILCFGDSLTAGYSRYGMLHFPYASHLKDKLQLAFPSMKIHIDVEGMSGAQVRGQYLGRLSRACTKKDRFYDWIIIMGGTNDLGWGGQPQEVYEALRKVWDLALDNGGNVLALNIIECASSLGTIIQRRVELNELIQNHEQDRWHSMDLCRTVPYFSLEEAEQDAIWDDGLHLTEEGYKMMGEAVAARLIELLPSPKDVKDSDLQETTF